MIASRFGPVALGLALALMLGGESGCYRIQPSNGGAQARFKSPRRVDARDVQVPAGYRVQVVSTGLTFPTGVAFDDQGRAYVTESGYSYGEKWRPARLVRIEDAGGKTIIAQSNPSPWNNGPWNGVTFYKGSFYVAEGGERFGGRILRIHMDGKIDIVVDHLPSFGDHHTNGPVIGPDGMIYFGQGSATNSGIVGADNANQGWLNRFPEFHDIPAHDVTLRGVNITTTNVIDISRANLTPVQTGAYSAYGVWTWPGEVIPGAVPCTGAVMKAPLDGKGLEVVAWGLRNPYGLAFSPDGQLFATDNSYDVRGARPIYGTGDLLWRLNDDGRWFGWPDYFAGEVVSNRDRFQAPMSPAPKKLLAVDPNPPPQPDAIFPVHSAACGIDFSHSEDFGYMNQAFVAEFGDLAPSTGKVLAPVGFQIVRVDVKTGVSQVFAANRGKKIAPASKENGRGLERPIAVRFDPSGKGLYVVDFGVITERGSKTDPRPNTGVLWRITREAR